MQKLYSLAPRVITSPMGRPSSRTSSTATTSSSTSINPSASAWPPLTSVATRLSALRAKPRPCAPRLTLTRIITPSFAITAVGVPGATASSLAACGGRTGEVAGFATTACPYSRVGRGLPSAIASKHATSDGAVGLSAGISCKHSDNSKTSGSLVVLPRGSFQLSVMMAALRNGCFLKRSWYTMQPTAHMSTLVSMTSREKRLSSSGARYAFSIIFTSAFSVSMSSFVSSTVARVVHSRKSESFQ
mmetsp:Transcript_44870/g.118473  ORF Transcript_44870/g.118473 Transcript_44870/m.118473 type:complete len:245 (+) Transcript_44870:1717-2451(+)